MASKDKAKNIAEKVELLIGPAVEALGYILWDVEYKKEGSDYNLIITIDKDGAELTLDDCVTVTNELNPILDEADPIPDSYFLEVSSAGLERELKRPEHFEKYIGSEVEVKLFAPIATLPKLFTGVLKEYTKELITLTVGSEDIALESSKVASVKPVVNYADIFKNN